MPDINDHHPVMGERNPPTLEEQAAALLERAAMRLEKPGAWIRGEFGRNALGDPVSPRAINAVCWCAVGGIRAETCDEQIEGAAFEALRRRVAPGRQITDWNDDSGRTQAEVVAEIRATAADLGAGK